MLHSTSVQRSQQWECGKGCVPGLWAGFGVDRCTNEDVWVSRFFLKWESVPPEIENVEESNPILPVKNLRTNTIIWRWRSIDPNKKTLKPITRRPFHFPRVLILVFSLDFKGDLQLLFDLHWKKWDHSGFASFPLYSHGGFFLWFPCYRTRSLDWFPWALFW